MPPEIVVFRNQPTDKEIADAGVEAVLRALNEIFDRVKNDPTALHKVWNEPLEKHQILVDVHAEYTGRECLKKLLPDIQLRGEESSQEEVSERGLAALMDMLDGSDLLERELGNWCSSLVLFRVSNQPRILSAVVGLPSKRVYYTRASKKDYVFVRPPSHTGTLGPRDITRVRLKPKNILLKDASVAFVGQKPGSLLSFVGAEAFIAKLRRISEEMGKKPKTQSVPKLRLYNLGGVPMMIALIEGKIDAVIEIKGQLCHDVVPGLVLALRAGATLKGLHGTDISEDDLASKLLDPKHSFGYVLACNSQLADELVTLLSTIE